MKWLCCIVWIVFVIVLLVIIGVGFYCVVIYEELCLEIVLVLLNLVGLFVC